MKTLKFVEDTVIDCSEFDRFVESVYKIKYSTVSGYSGNDFLGHYTYQYVDSEQWKFDHEYAQTDEYRKELEELYEKYPSVRESDDDAERPSFEEWIEMDGMDAHNNSPVIDEMVWHLRKQGYYIPDKFIVLVDW